MKKLIFILCTAVVLWACSNDESAPVDKPASLLADPSSLVFEAEGGSQDVQIITNCEKWEVHLDDRHFTAESFEGGFTVTAPQNFSTGQLKSCIEVVGTGRGEQVADTVVIIQNGAEQVTLKAEPVLVNFPVEGGEQTIEVTVTGTDIWEYTTNASWLHIEKAESALTVTAAKNVLPEELTAALVLTAGVGKNTAEVTVEVVQEANLTLGSLIFELTVPAGAKAGLPVYTDGTTAVNCVVDWGDGNSETVTVNAPTHVYEQEGIYEVSVTGTVTRLNSNNPVFNSGDAIMRDYITAVKQWGTTGLTSMYNAFWHCTKLRSIPADTQESFRAIVTFENAFEQCSALEALPEGLFSSGSQVESFSNTFCQCTSLISLPENLFASCRKVTDFFRTFWKCTSLESIGKGIFADCTEAVDFSQCFYTCTALTTIPVSIFDDCRKATGFKFTFGKAPLAGESPYTVHEGVKIHLYERADHSDLFTVPTEYGRCFQGCTSLSDYEQIEAKGWN